MAITWTDVTALAPSLSTISVAGQNEILARVALEVGPGQWGALQTQGQLALARHLGVVSLRGTGAPGPLISETVGPLSRQFAAPILTASALSSTPWGAEYARLRALLPCRFGLLA